MNELNAFSNFSGLKPNKTKCEIAGIGVLNGLQVALCGMKCVDLNNETVKILGVHFSYNKNLEQDKNFSDHIIKMENILKVWRMRQLTLEGRITVFKSLAISKVIHLLMITKLHNNTIDIMYKIQKNFIWQGKKAKIKHSTLYNGYENGGLKNVDLRNKITSIQCSWVKRLFEDDFHDWKVIPIFLIGKYLCKNFKFHNNIELSNDILSKCPSFYQDIFIKWINNYTEKPTLPFMILSEFIWFNSNIKVDSKPVHFSFFSDKNLNFIGQLFNDNGKIEPWEDIEIEFHLQDTKKIYWLQIIDALPKSWKDIILKDKGNAKNLVIFDHHIIRKTQLFNLNKLTSKELYSILVDANTVKPTAQDYFQNLFEPSDFNWKKIYLLIRNSTLDTKARMFQYKTLHNTLYVNKMLFKFVKEISPRCSFCKLHEETIMHLFHDYVIVKRIWNQLKSILSNNINFSISTPQSAIFGFWDLDTNENLILNHLLLIFKMYIYNARTRGYLNVSHLLMYTKSIKDIEKKLCENDAKKIKKFIKNWENILIEDNTYS